MVKGKEDEQKAGAATVADGQLAPAVTPNSETPADEADLDNVPEADEKLYTPKELQSEVDRRVTQALKTAKDKAEKEQHDKTQQDELGKLEGIERARKELEIERAKLAEAQTELKKTRIEHLLREVGLDVGMSQFINPDSELEALRANLVAQVKRQAAGKGEQGADNKDFGNPTNPADSKEVIPDDVKAEAEQRGVDPATWYEIQKKRNPNRPIIKPDVVSREFKY